MRKLQESVGHGSDDPSPIRMEETCIHAERT